MSREIAYESLKTKEKSSVIIPKVVSVAYGGGPLRELLITKLKSQLKHGFRKSRSLKRVATSTQYLRILLNKQNKLANYQSAFLHGSKEMQKSIKFNECFKSDKTRLASC